MVYLKHENIARILLSWNLEIRAIVINYVMANFDKENVLFKEIMNNKFFIGNVHRIKEYVIIRD